MDHPVGRVGDFDLVELAVPPAPEKVLGVVVTQAALAEECSLDPSRSHYVLRWASDIERAGEPLVARDHHHGVPAHHEALPPAVALERASGILGIGLIEMCAIDIVVDFVQNAVVEGLHRPADHAVLCRSCERQHCPKDGGNDPSHANISSKSVTVSARPTQWFDLNRTSALSGSRASSVATCHASSAAGTTIAA